MRKGERGKAVPAPAVGAALGLVSIFSGLQCPGSGTRGTEGPKISVTKFIAQLDGLTKAFRALQGVRP